MENQGTVALNGDAGFDYRIPNRLIVLDTARGAVLCVALVISAAVYSFNMMSFLHAKEAALCAGLVAMSILIAFRGHYYWNGFHAFAPLWAFMAFAVVRAFVSPPAVASDTALAVLRWSLVLTTAALSFDLLAQRRWRERIFDALILSAFVVAVLGLVQYWGLAPRLFPVFETYNQRVYSVFGNQDYFGGYIAVILPICLYRSLGPRRAGWAPAALAPLIPALLLSGSRSAWLAAAAGLLLVAPHLEWRPRRVAMAALGAAALVAATMALAPDATVGRTTSAFAPGDEGRNTRLWLWKAGHGMFRDYPMMGAGLGNYAYWSPRYLGEITASKPPDPAFHIERHADQPHSEPVRILAEAGIIGLLLWAWMLSRLAGARGPEWGIMAAYAVFALFNGVFDSVPHTLAALLAAGMMLNGSRYPFHDSERASSILPMAAMALCLLEVWAVLTPSVWLSRAEDAHFEGRPSVALYERVVNYRWPNARAHKGYADALAGAGRDAEAYVEFQNALKGLDTGDIYLALTILAVEENDLPAAMHWIDKCVRRWPHNAQARNIFQLLYQREPS